MKKLVIVESPTKAKTIRRFLGKDYIVESCMGHIRDLPGSVKELPENLKKKHWAHFGVNLDDDFRPIYCIPLEKADVVQKLKKILKSAGELILATDEDREGESISWHLAEILKPTIPVKRMVFHEITQSAITEALGHFRKVDSHLVFAQETRRILDRLVGYSISPFLWKKVLRGLSAGRVQSVAVSLVSQKELERLNFTKTDYWDLEGEHQKKGSSQIFKSTLVEYEGCRLVRSGDFDSVTGKQKAISSGAGKKILLMDEKSAQSLVSRLQNKKFQVRSVTEKQVSRKPSPPFITSTLQQESNRKFRFSSRRTMGLAQKLYEQGLITYMRTDSTFLSQQALKSARSEISKQFGKDYLPPAPRVYRKQAKGAQEAHEAIRPAGSRFLQPSQSKLSGDLLKLYELIWKRTIASQMKDCVQKQIRVEMEVDKCVFVSSGVTIQFAGFYRVYKNHDDKEYHLPPLKKGDILPCLKLSAIRHETHPPARYTEASLIQKLEKEGVGRPSTYASIITTVQDRGYVTKEKNSLIPTWTALIVDHLLRKCFPDYVNVQFTSEMEKNLDDIARGKTNHIKYLKSFYFGRSGLKKLVDAQQKQVKDENFRFIHLKGFDGYSFHTGPFGAYVSKKIGKKTVSASLPSALSPGEITKKYIENLIQNKITGGKLLGKHPQTQESIFVIIGRYGPYVEMRSDTPSISPKGLSRSGKKSTSQSKKSKQGKKTASATKKDQKKSLVRRVSLSPFYKEDTVTLEQALRLLELPKVLGKHPKTKKEIKKGLGRFGPYVVHERDYRSVPVCDFFDFTLKQALELLEKPKKQSNQILKDLGPHPKSSQSVRLMKGRFGPYIKYGSKNYTVDKNIELDHLDLETALKLIADRVDRPVKKGKKTTRSKALLAKNKKKKKNKP